MPQDGSQYDNGAYLFGFDLRGEPPVIVNGRCEYVAWIYDRSRSLAWENRSSFPLDPAGGTNLAVGLGINPEGEGLASTFTLELNSTEFFDTNPDADIRAFIDGNYIAITAPKDLIGDLGGVNFYSYCVEEGFSFDPADTGADQTGLIAMTDDDLGIVEMTLVSTIVETTTTIAETTTTTVATTESTVKSGGTVAVVEEEEEGGFPWGLVIGGGGIFFALIGWWLYNQEDDPCKELLEAWKAAQKACDEAQSAADDAADDCEDAEIELDDLKQDRRDMCELWPPACWSTDDGAWVEDEDGNRITSRDLHMKRMALGEVWDDYKAERITAQQVEARWREADTPEFREDMRETDEAAREELERIDEEIEQAEKDSKEACDDAEKAKETANEACAAAEAARKAYEDCVGAATAAADGGDEGTDGGPTGPSGPGVATGTLGGTQSRDPCEGVDPKREVRGPTGSADSIRINVDFSVIIGRSEGSERRIAAGQHLTFGLADLARDLDFAGDMLSARSAGLHVGGAMNGYAAGNYVATTSGVIRGGVEAARAVDVAPDVPTTPLQAGTEFLEQTARLGAFVAGKVTEWMANYQIMTVRRSFFYQTITATPHEIWECREGTGWVCVEKIWAYRVGQLRGLRGSDDWFTVNSDVRRRAFDRRVRTLSQSAANTIRRDAQRLAEWRAQHEAGPCGG